MRKSKQLRAQNILLKRAKKDVLGKYRETLKLNGLADENGQAFKIAQDPRNKKEDKIINMSISNFSNMDIEDKLLDSLEERNKYFNDQIKEALEYSIGNYKLSLSDEIMNDLLNKLHITIYNSLINFIPLFELDIDGILSTSIARGATNPFIEKQIKENIRYIKDKINEIYTDITFMYSSFILLENVEFQLLSDLDDKFKLGAFYTLMQHNMMLQDNIRMDNLDKIFFFGVPKDLSSFRLAELDGKWYTPMDFDDRLFTNGEPSKRILNIIDQSMLDKKIQEVLVSKFHNDKESIQKIYDIIEYKYQDDTEINPKYLDNIDLYPLDESKLQEIINSKISMLKNYLIENNILSEEEINTPLYRSFKVRNNISSNREYIIMGCYLIPNPLFRDTPIEELAKHIDKFIRISNAEEYDKMFKGD